jgi:hypothetical protein
VREACPLVRVRGAQVGVGGVFARTCDRIGVHDAAIPDLAAR